ncbi:endonuclease/exonuclease/phosphatase family protein [archaeon]|nr:endonuclease/exonuclease/phosphatase family protein [archaeon]
MVNSKKKKRIRFIFYNTEYFEGLQGVRWKYLEVWKRIFGTKRNLLKICKEISAYKPDVLAFIEIQAKSFFRRERYDNIVRKEMKMKHSLIKPKYFFHGLTRILKYTPGIKDQSNALFSKKSFCDSEFVYFKEGVKKLIIKASVKVPKKITFLIVHLALAKGSRQKQMEELAEIVRGVKTPIVLAGDFNTFGGKEELDVLIKNSRLRKVKESLTFPAFHPNKVLDHILISPEIRVKNYEVLKLKLSDHLPVMVDFEVR